MMNPTLQRELFTAGRHLFTILDGAVVPGLLVKLHRDEPEQVCLYQGELLPDRTEIAPYLVRLERDSRFTDWLFDQGWGKHWGIFAQVALQIDLKQVRKHFRTFLRVALPNGQFQLFRYYDPRIFRVLLPQFNAEETQRIFGPVSAYLMESPEEDVALRYIVNKGLPHEETLRLG